MTLGQEKLMRKTIIVTGMAALLGVSCVHTGKVSPRRAERITEQYLRQIPNQKQELIDAQEYRAIATQDGWAVVVATSNRVSLLDVDASTARQARSIARARWSQSGKETDMIGFLPFRTTDGWRVAVGKHGDFVVIYVDADGGLTKEPGWTE